MPTPAFATLLEDLLGPSPALTRDRIDERILDAAIELIASSGERNLTIDAVAARSGVARATIFRRCAVDVARVAAAGAPTVDAALAAAHEALTEHCLAHPVIQRLARAEVDGFVRLWTDGSPSGIDVLTHLLRDLALQNAADSRPPTGLDEACATLARLLLATLLVPADRATPAFDRDMRARVTAVIVSGLVGD